MGAPERLLDELVSDCSQNVHGENLPIRLNSSARFCRLPLNLGGTEEDRGENGQKYVLGRGTVVSLA